MARRRAESLQAIVQWDKTGQVAEGAVYQALSDAQPDVRTAALSAINNNPFGPTASSRP
jgi:hypothetical protein